MTPTNHALFLAIHNLAGRNVIADAAGIFFAEWLPYLLVLGFLAFALMQKGARRRMYVFAEGALAVIVARGIVTPLIQFFYQEPRPFTIYGFMPLIGESGASFPSAHMTLFFALAMAMWYTNRKWGWWYLALTALMGIARIFVGVHWPFDVLAGAAIGIACAMSVHWLLGGQRRAIESRTNGNKPDGGGPAAHQAEQEHRSSAPKRRQVQVDSLEAPAGADMSIEVQ